MTAAPFIVDSHCHLDFPDFDADRDALIERAQQADVRLMVTISTRVARLARLLELTRAYPNVYASVGTHPLSAGEEPDLDTDEYVRWSAEPKIVAIGEAGLDYFHEGAPPAVQERVFRKQIAAARVTGLPLVIHSRECDADMMRILTDEIRQERFGFVLHCFTAGRELAEHGLALGGYVSFSGILAFKRSEDLRAIAVTIPDDRILVETDAPYLAPPPNRGKRNEPAFVRDTAAALAEVKGLTLEELATRTSDNFFRLFSKVPDPRQAAAKAA
ncbi:LuxR family transcriptional regulator [Aureimonas endophytica]|uniref:LuxR family transcriptional regulator n=1 Tax=Aureimonas endophytica TaxID=2027858 RepID=A0A916ZE45_9HYPH|nr:TatD family hydrolase [Aureimonas endophytica]GGD89100.1 LuxR family transcriptional regulator [Aureimonas endophytica]